MVDNLLANVGIGIVSLLPSRRDLPTFDGSAFLKTELLNGSSFPNENNAAGFPGAIGIREDS